MTKLYSRLVMRVSFNLSYVLSKNVFIQIVTEIERGNETGSLKRILARCTRNPLKNTLSTLTVGAGRPSWPRIWSADAPLDGQCTVSGGNTSFSICSKSTHKHFSILLTELNEHTKR